MKKYTAEFLLSATASEHFPVPKAPEAAFLGRSNVGKSSLINALLGVEHARVSSTPGRTRAINFFAVHGPGKRGAPEMYFADLPGYGYAKISRSISAEWPKFISPYLEERPTLALCVCLVDMNVPPQENDQKLIAYLQGLGRSYLVVGTKADKLSGNGLVKALRVLQQGLGIESLLPCSARTGRGIAELWARILTAAHLEE
jgi:GTP-binding protein